MTAHYIKITIEKFSLNFTSTSTSPSSSSLSSRNFSPSSSSKSSSSTSPTSSPPHNPTEILEKLFTAFTKSIAIIVPSSASSPAPFSAPFQASTKSLSSHTPPYISPLKRCKRIITIEDLFRKFKSSWSRVSCSIINAPIRMQRSNASEAARAKVSKPSQSKHSKINCTSAATPLSL